MRTFGQAGVIALMAVTFSATGVAVATGFDVVVVTATVDGKAGHWVTSRSATPEPTPAIGATTPSATPSAEPVIPATTNKAKSVLVVAAVGGLVGVGGFAVAAFVQDSTTGGVSGSAEAMTPATVTGAQVGTLLPGEKAYVTLTLFNQNANVKIRLVSVTGADPLLPTLAVSEANFPYKLTDAVKMKDDTDIRCQAMTFHTTWTAQFQAVR
ncbi:hypothetical protein AB0F52_09180 [Amycolatopsis sp. NPDC024027]|uniref:hypothetical protein n=1 Tax=Amycolatopsis sp. NPDC024027 TaxID=3154327 RepID=UPI0033E5CAEE